MQSPKEFAQSIQDASSFVIWSDNRVQFVNIDIIAKMIEERDEAIRNEVIDGAIYILRFDAETLERNGMAHKAGGLRRGAYLIE